MSSGTSYGISDRQRSRVNVRKWTKSTQSFETELTRSLIAQVNALARRLTKSWGFSVSFHDALSLALVVSPML